jgi:hypothetical protein
MNTLAEAGTIQMAISNTAVMILLIASSLCGDDLYLKSQFA